jgi:hypothetical protein
MANEQDLKQQTRALHIEIEKEKNLIQRLKDDNSMKKEALTNLLVFPLKYSELFRKN